MTLTGAELVQQATAAGAPKLPEARASRLPAEALPEQGPSVECRLEGMSLNLQRRPAPEWTFLFVQEVWNRDRPEVQVQVANGLLGRRAGDTSFNPTLPINRENLTPEDVWRTMVDFSLDQRGLMTWFSEVVRAILERHQRAPVLIIEDRSHHGIPWEMFHLHATNRKLLGAEMTAVRWRSEFTDDCGAPVLLGEDGADCEGRVVTHLDPDERRVAGVDEWVQPLLGLSAEDHPNIRDLFSRLQKKEVGVGLVYLLCHGFLTGGPLNVALGSHDDEARRVRRGEYLSEELGLFACSNAVVFVNACSAVGATRHREFIGDNRRVGFSDLFIMKGARGVIGPLDSVELLPATRTAGAFLSLLAGEPTGIAVAEALRRLRAAAVPPAGGPPTEEQLNHWYHTFLYVFYGHPSTKLTLGIRGGDAHG